MPYNPKLRIAGNIASAVSVWLSISAVFLALPEPAHNRTLAIVLASISTALAIFSIGETIYHIRHIVRGVRTALNIVIAVGEKDTADHDN